MWAVTVFVVLSHGEIVGRLNLVLHKCASSVYFGSVRVLLLLLLLGFKFQLLPRADEF